MATSPSQQPCQPQRACMSSTAPALGAGGGRRGQRLGARPAGGLSVPGGPGALSRSQGHSVSGFHPVFRETAAFPASTSGQQGGPWVGVGRALCSACVWGGGVPSPCLALPAHEMGNWTKSELGSSASHILGIVGSERARAGGGGPPAWGHVKESRCFSSSLPRGLMFSGRWGGRGQRVYNMSRLPFPF